MVSLENSKKSRVWSCLSIYFSLLFFLAFLYMYVIHLKLWQSSLMVFLSGTWFFEQGTNESIRKKCSHFWAAVFAFRPKFCQLEKHGKTGALWSCGDHVARYVCVQLLDFPLCGLWRSVRFITFFRRFYHKCTHHHDETRNTVNMIASSVQCCRCLLLTAAGGAELHKSSLHVHTVASPSSMHFSAPCIQQARNRTTEKSTWLICKLQ